MFELDQANDNFVSNEQLINKIAEQTGITERTRVPRSQHETKRILIERIERFRPPLFTRTDYESYAMRQLQVEAELLAKKKIYCLQNNLPFNDAESFTLNIDVVPKKTRSPHPWRRQPATAREDTAVPGPTWTPPPSSVEWVNIFLNACQIFLQTTHL